MQRMKWGVVASSVAASAVSEAPKARATPSFFVALLLPRRAPVRCSPCCRPAKSAARLGSVDVATSAASASGTASRFLATKPSTPYTTSPAKWRTPNKEFALLRVFGRNSSEAVSLVFLRWSAAVRNLSTRPWSAPDLRADSSSKGRTTHCSTACTTGALSRKAVAATATFSCSYSRASFAKTWTLKWSWRRSFARLMRSCSREFLEAPKSSKPKMSSNPTNGSVVVSDI
mmetsp:Transcript_17692/g.53979  ORF Transcript_17692/g.53979 Transcript_17692/m.53979 type:complete len:230 (+) Transcript_17692:568-1257(+)